MKNVCLSPIEKKSICHSCDIIINFLSDSNVEHTKSLTKHLEQARSSFLLNLRLEEKDLVETTCHLEGNNCISIVKQMIVSRRPRVSKLNLFEK